MGRRQWSVWHQACYCPGQLELNPWGTVWSLGLCTSISTGYWLKITTEGSDSLALQTWLGVDRVDWRSERAQCQKDHQATVPHRYGCVPMVIGTGALDESYLWLLFFMSLFSLCAWCWGGTYDWVQLFLETDCNLVMNLKKNLR
jgi:hypothetical protein